LHSQNKNTRTNELMIANKELIFQNKDKQKGIAKLIIANKKLIAQNEDSKKKVHELIIANKELVSQNKKNEKTLLQQDNSNLKIKRAEEKVIKANRLYSFISHINKTISRVKDEQTLFNEACKIAIEQGKFKMAWIGIINTAHRKIGLVASKGLLKSDSKTLANKTYDIDGPTEKVLQGANYYIVNDIQAEQKISLRKYAKKRGFNSSICLPIKKEGKVIGTFDMYSTEAHFFDIEEIKMLEEVAGDITFGLEVFEKDRKNREADELIINNEKRFRALIENSSDMVTLANKEGRIVYGSPSIKKILGYTLEELLLKYPQDLIHPEELQTYLKNTNEILKTPGKSFHFEDRRRNKNGKWIWCEGTVRNMLDEPSIYAVVSNFRDVTIKVKAEDEKKQLTNRLILATKSAKMGIWDWRIKTNSLKWDEGMYLLYKINEGEFKSVYDGWLSRLHPEDIERVNHSMQQALVGKAEYNPTFRIVWRDSSVHYIEASGIIERDDKGNPIRMTGANWEITEVIEKEQQLQKSEAFNRGILSSLSSHIAVVGGNGKIIAVNESWKRFGIENGETFLPSIGEGANYFEACNKSIKAGDTTAAKASQGIKDVLNHKTTNFYFEYPCHSPNEQRWFAMRVTKFESNDNMVVVSHQNITERIKAESDRDHTQVANEELKKIRQELNNALEKEKDLNELKTRFVAMASHEFRTPLTTMMSSLSLTKSYCEKNDKVNVLKHIGKIKTAIHSLTDILNDFLSLSKLEEGKIENTPEEINLKNFVVDIVVEMQLMAAAGKKIKMNYSGNEIAYLDKKILRNVLLNLISNAIKFSTENGLINVRAQLLNSSVKIAVKDNGIGISKEDQKQLFERFFRGQNATHIQGTGLGLNIVAKYVEQMKGSITFESEENKGTTFTIIIPQ
jgi:PAS domain S-box-containing protein